MSPRETVKRNSAADRRNPGVHGSSARDSCDGKAVESARSVARNTYNWDKKEAAAPRGKKWRRRRPRSTCGYESFFLQDSSGPCVVFKHRLIRKHDKRHAIKTYLTGCSWNAIGIVFCHVITGPKRRKVVARVIKPGRDRSVESSVNRKAHDRASSGFRRERRHSSILETATRVA